MDLKEVVSVVVLVDNARWLLKTHAMKLSLIGEDKVTDLTVEEKINEMRKNYASLATVVERIQKMNLKETTMALFGNNSIQ
jgi:hypothetical protein